MRKYFSILLSRVIVRAPRRRRRRRVSVRVSACRWIRKRSFTVFIDLPWDPPQGWKQDWYRIVPPHTTPYPLPPISPKFALESISGYHDSNNFYGERKHELVKISVFRLARKFERRKTVYKFRKYQIPGIADLEVGGFFLMFYSFGGPLKQYSMGYGLVGCGDWNLEILVSPVNCTTCHKMVMPKESRHSPQT